ncbi:MAG: hypothetical protein M4579_003394 [Chaenotheca gracillima]|nr:MAG: hypothetical protein M4579_003394 [Chaenotheca gracillima]
MRSRTPTVRPENEDDRKALRMSYKIGRGEQGVLTFEPYKSQILPLWRFRTVEIAQKSSHDLWEKFKEYDALGDFVGMDMTRKFIQMGMTRAKRYGQRAGGRKYSKETGEELDKSSTHKGANEKMAASDVFREVWERCRAHEGYLEKKEAFMKEQKQYAKDQRSVQ